MAGWPGGVTGWPDGRVDGWPDGLVAGWAGVAGWPDWRSHVLVDDNVLVLAVGLDAVLNDVLQRVTANQSTGSSRVYDQTSSFFSSYCKVVSCLVEVEGKVEGTKMLLVSLVGCRWFLSFSRISR